MDDRPSMGRSRGRGRGQDVRPGQQVAVPPAGSGTPVAGQGGAWGGRELPRAPAPYGVGSLIRPAAPVLGVGIRPTLPPLPIGRAQGAFIQQSSSDSSKKVEDRRESNIRGTLRGKRETDQIIITKPINILSKIGSTGNRVTLTANYFNLLRKPQWTIHQYRIDFKPMVHMEGFKRYLIAQFKEEIGGYLFDGTQLFTIRQLDGGDAFEKMVRGREGDEYLVCFKYVKVVSMTDSASLQVLNLILRHAMHGLKLQLVGRNYFDPNATNKIPEFKIELWPGYTTSIRQHEHNIMLCAEITHKVMRLETIYDIMARCRREERDFQTAFKTEVLGTTVLTDYNNKTYRIDDVDFTKKASDTFETKNGPISFIDYYKNRYNIIIRDPNQPLIVSKSKAKDVRSGADDSVSLIPELCRATGITDKMRACFKTMKAMADYTRMGPPGRINKLRQFNQRLLSQPDSIGKLREFELDLAANMVEVAGRELPFEKILFGNGKKYQQNERCDWTADFRNNAMYTDAGGLKRWYVLCTERFANQARDFVAQMLTAARGNHYDVKEPRYMKIPDDRQNTYVEALEKAANDNPQLIMVVVPNNNADRYANIKKKCYLDRAIPTQVIVQKTITPKAGKPVSSLLSVATKVVIQINCKLGGAPWMIELPLPGLMTVGFDVCHDTKDKSKSFGALVATMDLKKSARFFSAVSAHKSGEELSNDLNINMKKALQAYRTEANTLPERICFYRDGVGEGQVQAVLDHELVTLKKELADTYANAGLPPPKFAYIIVSKRINTRLFKGNANPIPGTVVDDVITLPERYDFYLVSQSVRQGTVSPTSYNVVHDTMGLPADKLQLLTYKMCHLYYNWNGTVRVPAPCQYAHKLAFLVSQSIHSSPHHDLEKLLYFL